MYQACPKKHGKGRVSTTGNTTYADIAAHDTPPRPESQENRNEGAAHTKQVNQSEDPMEETSELTQTDRQLPSECTTDPQTEQSRAMTHSGDSNDEATSQQQAGGQKEGDAMEIRETIPEYTPVPDVTSMKNNVASRHKASNKAWITLKGTAAGTSQRNVKKNTETSNSPKRLKKIRVEGTGEQPHERKRSKTRRSTQKNEQP